MATEWGGLIFVFLDPPPPLRSFWICYWEGIGHAHGPTHQNVVTFGTFESIGSIWAYPNVPKRNTRRWTTGFYLYRNCADQCLTRIVLLTFRLHILTDIYYMLLVFLLSLLTLLSIYTILWNVCIHINVYRPSFKVKKSPLLVAPPYIWSGSH